MYALVIGASEESVYAIKKAQSMGCEVMAFDGNSKAEGLKYADQSFVVDIRKPENIYQILDQKKISPKDMVVLPIPIGRYLITSGSVNEHYGLIGANRETAEICTDKWLFHKTLYKAGLRNINCTLLKKGGCHCEIENFPIIAKPRYGAGSRQVISISGQGQWEAFLDRLPFDEDFIIEEEVTGTEYGIDGMVENGTFHLVLTRKKLLTPPPYRQCVGYISVNDIFNQALINRIENFMEKLINIIGLKNGIIHADIIDDGKMLFVIEMSARPSGHRLHDLFTPLVTGIDMIASFLNMADNRKTDFTKRMIKDVYMIRYFDMESEVLRIPDEEKITRKYGLLKYECKLKPGKMEQVKDGHSLMGRGYFIVKGKGESEVCQTAENVVKEFVS